MDESVQTRRESLEILKILNNSHSVKVTDCLNNCFYPFGFVIMVVCDNESSFSSNEFHKYCEGNRSDSYTIV